MFSGEALQFRSSEAGETSLHLQSPVVLLVDDNELVLEVTADLLRSEGFTVLAAGDAAHALQMLAERVPDVIVSDIMMPEIDGYAFYQQVLQHARWCQIPFIFLTALGTQRDVRMGKELGCDDYLVKPFEPRDLVAVINGKLMQSRRRESVNRAQIEDYRRRIVNTLSHEFRTPLVAINTGSELLIDQHSSLQPDRVKTLLCSIHRGGQRLQRLVNDFMALQQIDSGSAAMASIKLKRTVSLLEMVEAAVDMLRECYGDECPEIRFDVPTDTCSEGWEVEVYETQIIDVLERILNNAAKFGGTSGQIQLSCRGGEGSVVVSIRDFGPGMPPEKVAEACQTFTQFERDRYEQQGCGIGLAIANYYTELNGGKLTFCSPPNGGLEVLVEFPALR